MKKILGSVVVLAGALGWAQIACAQSEFGNRAFLQTLEGDDANPRNQFLVGAPDWRRTSFGERMGVGFGLEKTISALSSISVSDQWVNLEFKDPARRDTDGFEDLRIALKQALLTVPDYEFRLSVEEFVFATTGDKNIGAETHTRLGPKILWAWGWGNLIDELGLLRPMAMQGDASYSNKVSGSDLGIVSSNIVLSYSFDYLNYVLQDADLELLWPLSNLFVYGEFNYTQIVTGSRNHEPLLFGQENHEPVFRASPGIAYMDKYVEVSVATQLALNQDAVRNDHAAILGVVDFFLDDLIPFHWTPF